MPDQPDPDETGAYRPDTSPPSTAERFISGTLLAGRYRIVALLGRGGMGEVFRADDLKLAQAVALKFLPRSAAADPELRNRFHAEIRIARQVSHPHVCRVYDLNEVDGQPFLTMEYIDGQDLAGLLRQVGRLPEERGIEIARQLGSALAAVHEQGLLHRDLKPQNVMLDGRGKVRLTDFGLAALAGAAVDARSGTPGYQAPEQLAGREVSVQSDLYALGLVLYELFTGKRAFKAPSREELIRKQSEETPSKPSSHVSGLNPAIERVILRCLAAEPKDRPRSAYEVLAALPGGDPLAAALAAGETPSPQMVADAGGEGGLRPALAAALFVAILAGLVLIVFLAKYSSMVNLVPLPERPEFLVRKAQDAIKELGFDTTPRGSAFGFSYDRVHLKHLEKSERSPTYWERLASDRPAPITFWYRQSTQPLVMTHLVWNVRPGTVTATAPSPFLPGMAGLELDPAGHLLTLLIVPDFSDQSVKERKDPDFLLLFRLAGLEFDRFQRVPPTRNPPIFADQQLAWTGTFPNSDVPIRLEAAFLGGRPVYFQVIAPWNGPEIGPFGHTAPEPSKAQLFDVIRFLFLSLVGCLLAFRNWRLGRADRLGAFRVFWAVFLLVLVDYVLSADYAAATEGVDVLAFGVSFSLFIAAENWLAYLAIESLARRFWPKALITWSRLLAGRLRDPLVGRDLLLGVAVGVALCFALALVFFTARLLGLPPIAPYELDLTILLGGRRLAGGLLRSVPGAFQIALFFNFLYLLVLRIVFRKMLLVTALFIFTNAFVMAVATVSVLTIAMVPLSLLVVWLLVRCGLLAAVSFYVVVVILAAYAPLTPDLSAWYAGGGFVAVGVVVALAGYGFYTSLAGRPVFGKEWLGD